MTSTFLCARTGNPRTSTVSPSPGPATSNIRQFVYLDAANIILGGSAVSAVRRGLAPSAMRASENRIFDPAFRINFRRFRFFFVGDQASCAARTVCVASQKAGSAGLKWTAAERAEWIVIAPQRARSGREKEVETTISVMVLDDLWESGADPNETEVTFLSGDRDVLPAVRTVQRRGYAVDVAAWSHTASSELKRVARRFIRLDDHFDYLCFCAPQH